VASLFVVMSLITILKHHENIRRLDSGTESRIGDKG
jgi:glycerol-3-phosphate acyltransferase PlsY